MNDIPIGIQKLSGNQPAESLSVADGDNKWCCFFIKYDFFHRIIQEQNTKQKF